MPKAEEYFRSAYEDSPRNFSAARELAAICLIRDNHDDAERFAREAFDIAPDNAFLLDILLSVLIRSDKTKVTKAQSEIEALFGRLQRAGEEPGRSFYTTRRAEYELRWGDIGLACKLIDEAVSTSPAIFNVHALRAEIYLERGNNSIAHDEIAKLRTIVYRDKTGERLTNLRAYLVLEASYYAASRDFQRAKDVYTNRGVFTESEAREATRKLDIEEAFTRR